jgi:Tol biopolymer transport system component
MLVVAAIALAALLPATAPAADAPATLLLSRPSGLGALPSTAVNSSFAGTRTISTNGRFVAFASFADGLSPDDDDSVLNIYVRDTTTGVTELVSRSTGGAAANGDSSQPTLSSDGTRVAFVSKAGNLDPADPGNDPDVYLYDRATQATSLVSRQSDAGGGQPGDGASDDPVLSHDGMQIAFASDAANLSTEDGDARDVFVRNLAVTPATTQLVSRASGVAGATQNIASNRPSIDSAGTHVAFDTSAAFVTPDDNNALPDVYVRDLSVSPPLTKLVSRGGASDNVGDGASFAPAISANADRVAFLSNATTFDPSLDPNTRTDVYVRDLSSNATSLVSRADGPAGAVNNGTSSTVDISASGAAISFAATGTNLVAGLTSNTTRVFVRRPGVGTTVLASRDLDGQPPGTDFASSISSDGGHALFQSNADRLSEEDDNDFGHVYVRRLTAGVTDYIDRPTGTGPFQGGASNSVLPSVGRALSADGRYVVFTSGSDAFFPGSVDDASDHVWRRDLVTGETVLASRANGPDGAPAAAGQPTISADGSRVAFLSGTPNLVDGDTNAAAQVFVRDVAAGTTVIASRADGADGAIDPLASSGVISGDGNRVALWGDGNLAPGDTDGKRDVMVRDLASGRTILVSRGDGPDGTNAAEVADSASIDQTGNRVAFVTTSAFDPAASSPGEDVYVRDLGAGTTRLASRADATGPGGSNASRSPDISADGRRVAFESLATNLVTPDTNGAQDIFVRDLDAATTTLVSRGGGAAGSQGDLFSLRPSISADGARVAFTSPSTNLGGGTDGTTEHGYLRDLGTGSTTLISKPDGATALADGRTMEARLNGPGNCAAFDSLATNLVSDGYGTSDFSQVYLRVVDGTCPVPAPADPGGGQPLPPGGGQPPPPPPPLRDTLAPTLDRVSIAPRKFRVAGAATPVAARARRRTPAGARFKWRLSEAATVTLRIDRKLPGRRKGRRCVKPTRKLQKAKKCTRLSRVGTLRRKAALGPGGTAFSGRIGRKKLAPGSYRAVVGSEDAAGNASGNRTVTFKIVRR